VAQEQYLQSQIGLRLRSGTDLHRARRQLQLHFDLAEEIVEPRLKIDVHVEVTSGILEHSPAGAPGSNLISSGTPPTTTAPLYQAQTASAKARREVGASR
jgi:hypothetical protein